MATITSTK